MRPILAIRAFFAALLGRRLPETVIPQNLLPAQLPAGELPDPSADEAPPKTPEPDPAPPSPAADPEGAAVQVLAVLQAEGRLLDFLGEQIDGYEDADIGAAVPGSRGFIEAATRPSTTTSTSRRFDRRTKTRWLPWRRDMTRTKRGSLAISWASLRSPAPSSTKAGSRRPFGFQKPRPVRAS